MSECQVGRVDFSDIGYFALRYFAECRVSDVAHLLMEHINVGPKLVGCMLVIKERSSVILIC